MVEVATEVKGKILNFVDELKQYKIKIQKVFLYGSYAKGTQNEWSDIDVALVSEDFTGIRLIDKERMIKAISAVDFGISPLPYRPEDFDESDLFVKEIIKTGIRIV